MNARERRRVLLEIVADKGVATIDELRERFNVSDMTIRRDLSRLENDNLIRRIHGGAVRVQQQSPEPPFVARMRERSQEKQAIASCAASLVEEGDSIALDVGTTTFKLAQHLLDKARLTVITPSLAIANLLADHASIHLILTGGAIRRGEQALAGDIAEDIVNRFHVDKVFTGAGGVDLESGITDYNLEQTYVKRCLLRIGDKRILVADSHKFGRKALVKAAPLSDIDVIVTDDGLDQTYRQSLHERGIALYLAPIAEG